MPHWTLVILIPIALLAAFKMIKHERAAGSHIGNRFVGIQKSMKYGMVAMVGGVALVAFFTLVTHRF